MDGVTVLELTLLALATASALSIYRLHRRPALAVWSTAAAVAAWSVQLYTEGGDVFLVPVYLYLVLVASALRRLYRRPTRALAPRLLAGLGLGAAAIAAVAIFLASPPSLPEPSGSYPVGVGRMSVLRNETATVLSFYPADLPGAYRTPPPRARLYDSRRGPSGDLGRLADRLGVPPFVLSRVVGTRLPGYARVPVSVRRSRYPVIVVSAPNGWCGESIFHLAHELASHGTVVLAAGCGLAPEAIVEAVIGGVPDEAFAQRIAREGVEIVRLADWADASPEHLTDIDLLTRFPGAFGLSRNAVVRATLVPQLVRRFSPEL